MPDPLDLLAFLAAHTERLGLATGVLVLPNHHPVVLAKRVATVDALVGWPAPALRGDGLAQGGDRGVRHGLRQSRPPRRRTARGDAAAVGRPAGRREFLTASSSTSTTPLAIPSPPGGVPIHIGGHSRAAARRAGRLGDGFQPLGLVGSEPADLVALMRAEATQFGRDPDALELSLGHLVAKVDLGRAEKLAAMGADRVVLALPPDGRPRRGVRPAVGVRRKTGADPMSLNAFDRLALADLVHLYASAVDDRRFDDVVELFTETAELRLPDPPRSLEPVRRHHGRGGVREAMSAVAAVTRTEHAIVGEVYAPGDDADYALGRITCIAHHWSVTDGQISDVVWHLRYDDEYLRTRAGWRIHGRALTINAIETRPVRRVRGQP